MIEIAAVVPFRLPGLTRLAEVLGRDARDALALAMLVDVVAVLHTCGLEPTVAAADTDTAAAVGTALPDTACAIDRRGVDLNQSVARHAAAHPDGLLVVMADLPALQPDDVADVLARPDDVVVAETADGGTGGLARRPTDVIATAYGPRSATRHVALAQAADRSVARVRLPGFLFEVDVPTDLDAARSQQLGFATRTALDELDSWLRTGGTP